MEAAPSGGRRPSIPCPGHRRKVTGEEVGGQRIEREQAQEQKPNVLAHEALWNRQKREHVQPEGTALANRPRTGNSHQGTRANHAAAWERIHARQPGPEATITGDEDACMRPRNTRHNPRRAPRKQSSSTAIREPRLVDALQQATRHNRHGNATTRSAWQQAQAQDSRLASRNRHTSEAGGGSAPWRPRAGQDLACRSRFFSTKFSSVATGLVAMVTGRRSGLPGGVGCWYDCDVVWPRGFCKRQPGLDRMGRPGWLRSGGATRNSPASRLVGSSGNRATR